MRIKQYVNRIPLIIAIGIVRDKPSVFTSGVVKIMDHASRIFKDCSRKFLHYLFSEHVRISDRTVPINPFTNKKRRTFLSGNSNSSIFVPSRIPNNGHKLNKLNNPRNP
jgi:hypothetical protein